jgi:hypothetical protein
LTLPIFAVSALGYGRDRRNWNKNIAPCQDAIEKRPQGNQIAQLTKHLTNESKNLYSNYGKPGEPLKPVKNQAVADDIETSKQKIALPKNRLVGCETSPPSPAPSVAAFTASGIIVPDPQIAVE